MIEYKGISIPTWDEVVKMYDTRVPTDIMLKSKNYVVPLFGKKKVYLLDTNIRKGDLDQYNLKNFDDTIYRSAISFIDDLINKVEEKENNTYGQSNKKGNFRRPLQKTGRYTKERKVPRRS
jgi:hypothetical protein